MPLSQAETQDRADSFLHLGLGRSEEQGRGDSMHPGLQLIPPFPLGVQLLPDILQGCFHFLQDGHSESMSKCRLLAFFLWQCSPQHSAYKEQELP